MFPTIHGIVSQGGVAVPAEPPGGLTVHDVAYTVQRGSGSFDVTLPDYQAGDLLLVMVNNRGTPGLTTPSGWTRMDDGGNFLGYRNSNGSVQGYLRTLGRVADGSEGATLSLSGANTNSKAIAAYAIRGAGAAPAVEWTTQNTGSGSGGTVVAPDDGPHAPQLTPTNGVGETLYISTAGWANAIATPAAYPSNMPDARGSDGIGDTDANHAGIATAAVVGGASFAMDSFTLDAAVSWGCILHSIRAGA